MVSRRDITLPITFSDTATISVPKFIDLIVIVTETKLYHIFFKDTHYGDVGLFLKLSINFLI